MWEKGNSSIKSTYLDFQSALDYRVGEGLQYEGEREGEENKIYKSGGLKEKKMQ